MTHPPGCDAWREYIGNRLFLLCSNKYLLEHRAALASSNLFKELHCTVQHSMRMHFIYLPQQTNYTICAGSSVCRWDPPRVFFVQQYYIEVFICFHFVLYHQNNIVLGIRFYILSLTPLSHPPTSSSEYAALHHNCRPFVQCTNVLHCSILMPWASLLVSINSSIVKPK